MKTVKNIWNWRREWSEAEIQDNIKFIKFIYLKVV